MCLILYLYYKQSVKGYFLKFNQEKDFLLDFIKKCDYIALRQHYTATMMF